MWLQFPLARHHTGECQAVGGGSAGADDDRQEVAESGHLLDAKVPHGRGGSATDSLAQEVSQQEIRLCKTVIYLCCLTLSLSPSYQVLAVLLRVALGRHQDQCGASVPQVCFDRIAPELAVLRHEVSAQWRVAVLYQGVREPALCLHLGGLRGAHHNQELCHSDRKFTVTRRRYDTRLPDAAQQPSGGSGGAGVDLLGPVPYLRGG